MINLCPNRADYYTQLNNELDPKVSCQVTTIVAGLDLVDKYYIEVIKMVTPFNQPEDDLRRFIEYDPETLAFCKRSHPGSTIHPAEWADVLCFAVNKILGRKVVYFHEPLTIDVIVRDLYENRTPVMINMKFPDFNIGGHYLLVVGVDSNLNLIVNDPYKDFLNNKSDGFNIRFSPDVFNRHSKRYGMRYIRY